jgi:hypothetical protein
MQVLYVPSAIINHRIPRERTRKKWVLKRYYWQGVSDAVLDAKDQPAGRFGALRNVYWIVRGELLPAVGRYLFRWRAAEGRFLLLAKVFHSCGKLRLHFG